MVAAIEGGWVPQQVADAAWQHQREVESGERAVVGVNRFVEDDAVTIELHHHLEEAADEHIAGLRRLRAERDNPAVARALDAVRAAARGTTNLMPVLVDAVKTYATTGELCAVLRDVFGEYAAPQIY